MRLRTAASCIAIAMVAGACSQSPTGPGGTTSGITPSEVTLGLGKHQRFQPTDVPAPFDVDVAWTVPGGVDVGYISRSGIYYAPLRPPAAPTITVLATFSRHGPESTIGRTSFEATVRLTSSPADSVDCLAEHQPGDQAAFGSYVFVEELPEAIVKVAPIYPPLAREAGVDGLVMVQAHVCACGEVDVVRVVRSIPMLDDAAKEAVRQWIFKPGLSNGEPVAVWVGVPVKFSLH